MFQTLLPIVVHLLVCFTPGWSQAEPAPVKSADEIVADYEKAMKEFREADALVKDHIAKQELIKEKWPDGMTWLLKVRAALAAQPEKPASVRALAWLFHHERDKEARRQVWEKLCGEHLDSEAMAQVCASIRHGYPGSEPVLRQLVEKSPHRSVRGQACYALAQEIRCAGSADT